MNSYMRTYIMACVSYLESCKQTMQTAAIRNDGLIDETEEKTLKKFNDLTNKYIKSLQKLK